MVCDHVSCALRGYGPDFRKSGPFASLRSVQGAGLACRLGRAVDVCHWHTPPPCPLRGYPCALAGKVHPLRVCTFPARLKPNTVTLDRLPDTAGRRSFILRKRRSNMMDKSREELEKEYAEATAKLEQYQHRGQRYGRGDCRHPCHGAQSRRTFPPPQSYLWRMTGQVPTAPPWTTPREGQLRFRGQVGRRWISLSAPRSSKAWSGLETLAGRGRAV